MSTQHLLQGPQNRAVEDRYNTDIVFRLLRFVCEPILAEEDEYELRSGELFYHTIYSIDCIKGCHDELQRKEQSIQLWYSLINYCGEKGWKKQKPETHNVVCLIVYSVARCLLIADNPRFLFSASLLIEQVQQNNPSYFHKLDLRYNQAIRIVGEEKLSDYLCKYLLSDTLLSDEIELIIDANSIIQQTSSSKRGRPVYALFLNGKKEQDIERTNIEKERFIKYIHNHRLGNHPLDSHRENILMKIVASFWLQWKKMGYVASSPNGMAIYRFLKNECKLKCDVVPSSFGNCIHTMINDKCIDKSYDTEISYLFK